MAGLYKLRGTKTVDEAETTHDADFECTSKQLDTQESKVIAKDLGCANNYQGLPSFIREDLALPCFSHSMFQVSSLFQRLSQALTDGRCRSRFVKTATDVRVVIQASILRVSGVP